MTVRFEVNQSLVPVVPRQTGGRSFSGERTYKPKKLVAYRMCKGPPTGALPKSEFFVCTSLQLFLVVVVVVVVVVFLWWCFCGGVFVVFLWGWCDVMYCLGVL